jgi:hypothetical protein
MVISAKQSGSDEVTHRFSRIERLESNAKRMLSKMFSSKAGRAAAIGYGILSASGIATDDVNSSAEHRILPDIKRVGSVYVEDPSPGLLDRLISGRFDLPDPSEVKKERVFSEYRRFDRSIHADRRDPSLAIRAGRILKESTSFFPA